MKMTLSETFRHRIQEAVGGGGPYYLIFKALTALAVSKER
jgi:hypothetical protein